MSTSLSPASLDLGGAQIGKQGHGSVTVVGHAFTAGEVAIDGQDRAAFSASKSDQNISITFAPVTRGDKLARVKVLIESDGPPYWIAAQLNGTGI